MKLTPINRVFSTGRNHHIVNTVVAHIELDPNEIITFTTPSGGEYDVARKTFGYYATPSVNSRLYEHKLRAALVLDATRRLYVMLIEHGHESEFHKYCADEYLTFLRWIDDTNAVENFLEKLEFAPAPGEAPLAAINTNYQIEAYLETRPLKQHEEEMLNFICQDFPQITGHVLDLGCASGNFIQAMVKHYPQAYFTGLDLSETLLTLAKENLSGQNVTLVQEDILQYEPQQQFDVIVASGVLSIFDDFEPVLDRWLSWLKEQGRLYIFGPFNSQPIDTIIHFRNHYTQGGWEGGLTTYSVHTIGTYLRKKNIQFVFRPFQLQMDIMPNENPIRTYTINREDNRRLIVSGANVISDYYFLIIEQAAK